MSGFLNQLTGGIGQMFGGVGQILGGALNVVTSPLALFGDIAGGFGKQQCNQWMGNPNGAGCCGAGSYGPSGNYQHEMTQNARLANLEQRVRYDEATVNYRLARGGL